MPASFTLTFPKRLYTAGAVKKAVKTFAEDADMAVEKTKDGHTVTGTPHDDEVLQELQDELMNAALFYTVEGKKKW